MRKVAMPLATFALGVLAAGALAEVRPGVYRGVRDKWDAVDDARRKRTHAMAGGLLAIGAAILVLSQL